MKTPLLFARRATLIGALVAVTVTPLLQGCFPLVAAGVVGGAVMVADRRSSGAYVDDEAIELKARNLIRKHYGTLNHVNITSYNRKVLLTGEVQSEHARADIQRLTQSVSSVGTVYNELTIGSPSSLGDRTNDTSITTNVKARFLGDGKFHANHVKVVTEARVVYLMGIVTHAEAEQAVEIARTSKGVARVVRVFEYIGNERAEVVDHGSPTAVPVGRDDPPEAP